MEGRDPTSSATTLLDEFSRLPSRVARPRTFMEIAGYPHYENACSNILAFFMDPEESHGLGSLVLDAFAGAVGIADADVAIGGNVSVEREVNTNAGNRVDLLITSDDHAILIENKIYAVASNPFDDYAAYLDRVANDRAKHKILLTVFPSGEGSEWGFTNLTYEEFVGRIRSLLGCYVSSADTRYLTMFLDFMNTLESLHEGSRMDQGFIELLSERQEEAENFFYEMMRFKAELRKKVRELRSLINIDKYSNVEQSFYRQQAGLYDDLVHDISVSKDLGVRVDTSIFPQG